MKLLSGTNKITLNQATLTSMLLAAMPLVMPKEFLDAIDVKGLAISSNGNGEYQAVLQFETKPTVTALEPGTRKLDLEAKK